jgi:hypothetical protein
MESTSFWQLADLSDTQLRSDLAELLVAGCRTEARIIAHLAELEQRKLHLRDGSESLYHYCTVVLRLSNSESFHRITAARVARRFPLVFSLVERRQLHLTAVCLLRDYLTAENHRDLLAEASHKTKWQIEELLARRFPRPDVESRIRKLPAPRTAAEPFVAVPPLALTSPKLELTPKAEEPPSSRTAPAEQAFPRQHASSPHRTTPTSFAVEPLSEARYRIQLNASAALKDKLDRLRALTSHSNPSGDISVVIERALDVALEKVERERFAKTGRPRARHSQFVQAKSDGRRAEHQACAEVTNALKGQREHIPNAVLREIAERDQLRCSYRGPNGCRCTARAFLQVHHERPWARGGAETTQNLRLLCAAHNQFLAERDFGEDHVARKRGGRRRSLDRPSTE